MSTPHDVDVIQISDFRLPGGTSSSIAEEVRAQSAAGLETALVHAASTVTSRPIPWSTPIRRVLDLPGVHVASPRAHLRARLLVLRHPTVAASTPWSFEHIRADHVVVVANHSAIDAGGIEHYDVAATDARVRQIFGVEPVWAPIGPVVRGSILQQTTRVPLREHDWVNVFRMPETVTTRSDFVGDVPVIGRHSRPQRGKWPTVPEDILAAYPDSDDYRVEVLGGAQVAKRILGEVPTRWHVIPFGGEEPAEFLRRIDFWVYFHHPDLREAFGRAAMEALAAGAVAILPEYLRELFGDAALYGTPEDVRPLVDALYADKDRFLAQSAKGQEFARRYGPEVHLARLAEFGIRLRASMPPLPESPESGSFIEKKPTLFVAHHQSGDEAWSRLAELVKRVDGCVRPIAAIISTEFPTSTDPDPGPFEYIASQEALVAPDGQWRDYLAQRVARLLDRFAIERVVFDGGELPAGLTDALDGRQVETAWWKDGEEHDVTRP